MEELVKKQMEELRKKESVNELYRLAEDCGLDPQDAFNDVADSMEIANKLVRRSSPGKEVQQWLPVWVEKFFEEYHTRCFERWLAKCGNLKDYKARERLWFESFEPLFVAGCNVAKDSQLSNVKMGLTYWRSIHSDNLTRADQEAVAEWSDEWQAWYDKIVSQCIAMLRETQRRVMAKTFREVEGLMGLCPNCRAQVAESANFCPECGAKLRGFGEGN